MSAACAVDLKGIRTFLLIDIISENSKFLKDIFVTLEEIAGFLYIKAVWEIEDFEGYG